MFEKHSCHYQRLQQPDKLHISASWTLCQQGKKLAEDLVIFFIDYLSYLYLLFLAGPMLTPFIPSPRLSLNIPLLFVTLLFFICTSFPVTFPPLPFLGKEPWNCPDICLSCLLGVIFMPLLFCNYFNLGSMFERCHYSKFVLLLVKCK